MEYSDIQKLIDSMGDSKLTDLSIEFADGTKISMKKDGVNAKANQTTKVVETIVSEDTLEDTKEEKEIKSNAKIVKAPMVGTFYSKTNPASKPFAVEGDVVEKGQTLCIIEAMKLMNEIESEYAGTVKKVLVKDGEMVEYGQPLFEIE